MLDKGYLVGAAVYTTLAYSDQVIDGFITDSSSAFECIRKAVESGNAKDYLKGDAAHSGFKRLT